MKQRKTVNEKLRIVLICDNKYREFEYLLLVKKELQKTLHADVYIIGSLAEQQRMFFLLYGIKPHFVFLQQIVEQCCRDIAQYVVSSGGKVAILPSEVTMNTSLEALFINPAQRYNDMAQYFLLPGERMAAAFRKNGIDKKKIHIVGAPKMDLHLLHNGMSRYDFQKKYALNIKKKNLFIFTSFSENSQDYIHKDSGFKNFRNETIAYYEHVKKMKQAYKKMLTQLPSDFKNYNIILKPHPLEKAHFYTGIKKITLVHETVTDCLNSIDLAIHWNSTVAVECWIRNIRTIQYDPNKNHTWLSEFKTGNPVCSTYTELRKAIEKFSEKGFFNTYVSKRKAYIRNNFYAVDGKSPERICKALKKDVTLFAYDQLHYRRNFNYGVYVFDILDRIIGITLSRKIINMLFPKFNSVYATENYTYVI